MSFVLDKNRQKTNRMTNFARMVGKIDIIGDIGSFEGNKGVELIDVISQVKAQPEATSFEVTIQSDGGIVETGFDIYYYLKSLGLPVTTIGNKMVASIATVIFMAGSKRIVNPGTQFMIHLPISGVDYATADEMEAQSKWLRDVENRIINFYTKELGLNKEGITPLLRNETWLSESQLKALGFVTNTTEAPVFAKVKQKSNKMSKPSKLKVLLAALRGEVINKVIYAADEKEIVFPDLSEDAPIEIGAKATIDGAPADGEIVGADGKTYVFEAGVLVEIKDPADVVVVEDDEVMEAITGVLEVAVNLEERLKKVEADAVAVKTERDDFKAKLEAANVVIAKLKGSSPSPTTEPKEAKPTAQTVSDVVASWKKRKVTKK